MLTITMGNSFISCNVHYVFSTKNHHRWLTPDIRNRLLPYFGGICKEHGCKLIKGGGIEDHIHLLVSLSPTITISKAIQYLKGGSSRWIHETFKEMKDFAWQEGYGAFTISRSQLDQTIQYISNQEEHHKIKSFKGEFVDFLKFHDIEYEEKYLL